ncbi:aminopeptidase [Candidatus Woesearchaeota archaeon]|nr:aminopeptidase [Candidatus Woesearchaeota archaeon]
MNKQDLFNFLRREKLLKTVDDNYMCFMNVFQTSLNVSKEDVLIVFDKGYKNKRVPAIIAGCYAKAAEELGLNYKLSMQKPKLISEEADDNVIQDMLSLKDKSVLAIAISGKIGQMKSIGNSFRRFVKQHKHRFVSTSGLVDMPSSMFSSIIKSINVDYALMAKKGSNIKELLDKAAEIHVMTRKGTDLLYGVEGMKSISNDGLYTKPGMGGNIPAGEVYVPCNDRNVNGKIVIDGSMKVRDKTILLKKPVTLFVKDGEITKIKGNGEGLEIAKTLDWAHKTSKHPWGIKRIGELGIGINPNAKIVGPTIINEKTLGTAHFAIGSNAWFGGNIYSKIHLDQVITEPMIRIDGKLLNGVLMKN